MKITDEEIESKRTSAGGFSRSQLAAWGVNWPPIKGWRYALVHGGDPNSPQWKESQDTEISETRVEMLSMRKLYEEKSQFFREMEDECER